MTQSTLLRGTRLAGLFLLYQFAWSEVTPEAQAQVAPSNPPVEKSAELFRQSAIAYGGESKILSLQDGCYDYQVESVGASGDKPINLKACFKTDTLFRSEAKGDGLEAVTIINGNSGWVKVGNSVLSLPRKEIDPMRIGMVVQMRPDLLLVSFPKHRYTGQAHEDGKTLDFVEVSGFLAGEYVRGRLSFDSTTHLIYRYEYETEKESPKGKGILKGEERYLRYEEKGGLKIPAEILSTQGHKTSRLILNSVQYDPNLDPGLFQDPSGSASDSHPGKN
jgi:hypothetical protein